MTETVVVAALAFLTVALVTGASLLAWRDWLALTRERLVDERWAAGEEGDGAGDPATLTALAIELAALRERVRRVEAGLQDRTA